MREYYDLALAGDYVAARERWKALRPISVLNDDLNSANRIKNASYASSVGCLKAWFEIIGLRGGDGCCPPCVNSTRRIVRHLLNRSKN